MELSDLIRQIREKANLTQKEFANKLSCSAMHISIIERPFKETGKLPSEEFLRRVASVFSSSEEERISLQRRLLLERTKLSAPREIVEYFLSDEEKVKAFISSKSGMPASFIARLKKDLAGRRLDEEFFRAAGIDETTLNEVLRGRYALARETVITLAKALEQSVEDYLFAADYLPENVKKLIEEQKNGIMNVFRSLGELPAESVEKIIRVINEMLELYKKK